MTTEKMSHINKFISFGTLMSIAGVIFHAGRTSENIEILTGRVDCMDDTAKEINYVIYDIHGKVSKTETKVEAMEKEIAFIKSKLFNN